MIRNKQMVFIGAGNMARAIVRGLLAHGVADRDRVVATDVSDQQRALFQEELGTRVSADNRAAAGRADIVVLAVKPQQFGEVLAEIRPGLDFKKTLVISIAAGIPTGMIERHLGEGARVVRAMPNMPALAGQAATGLCAGRWAGDGDLDVAEHIFRCAGIVARVGEADMDAVTALSGSGPAYVFYLIEAMVEAGRRMGLNDEEAYRLILATVRGAAEVCAREQESPESLRARVTSKGGTTAAAIGVFEARGVKEALVAGMLAAQARARELASMMADSQAGGGTK